MKKYKIEHDIKEKDLVVGDVVILSRYQSLAYGEHYFNLGIVKSKSEKETIINVISASYPGKDYDKFVEDVELYDIVCDVFNTSKHKGYISKIDKNIVKDVLKIQLKVLDTEIQRLKKEKERLKDFYNQK